MKRSVYILAVFFCVLAYSSLLAQSADPIVTNVAALQREGSTTVDVYYDLYDPDSTAITVWVAVSTNNAATFDIAASHCSGNGYGNRVMPGSNLHIIWDAGADMPGKYVKQTRIRVMANDVVGTADMVLIPAGTFDMGDTFSEGATDELPVHSIYVNEFYMDKYEVSNEKMRQVMQWAYNHGKITATSATVQNDEGDPCELLNLDGSNCQISYANGTFSVDSGKATYPCVEITWFGAIAYCKYKNEMEGKEQTINLADWSIDWSKNGYRLPTEAEWEKAARGGAVRHRFPWTDTDTISHNRANYNSYWRSGSPYYPYDVSPTEGYHPDYYIGFGAYISPVGSFAPNGYGLYDMAGNLWEWCWDWYDVSYYSVSPSSDPRGPDSGDLFHVIRGGCWSYFAGSARCANRFQLVSSASLSEAGFRCVCR